MRPLTKPLMALDAADLMSCDLVLIPEDLSMQAAARRMAAAGVSGAPVVSADGRCVGVISSSDFLAWVGQGGPAGQANRGPPPCAYTAWQIIDLDSVPQEVVRRHMTPDPVGVVPATPVRDLARMMVDADIHRLIVVQENDRPVGIVSSTDLLAAMAYAPEEGAGSNRGVTPAEAR